MFQRRAAVAITTVCAVVVVASCGSSPPPGPAPSQVIARVASQPITLAQFDTRYHSALISLQQVSAPANNPAQTTALRTRILRSLIVDTVLREEAAKLGLDATPSEIQAEIATDAQQAGGMSALETELASAGGSIAQLQDEISSGLNEQRVENHFAQARAALIEKILAAGANFATTARNFSDDTGTSATTTGTGAKGGDLGVLTAAELKTYDPAFSAAVQGLAVNAYTTTPVHDAGGYDIVMLYSKSAKGWGVRHILIYAGTPYSVTDRPGWFTESLFTAIRQLCTANEITVTLNNAGGNPCTSPSPSPTPGNPSPTATPAKPAG
jgi:SurA N-terminal domain/PPIC-type PPIASE domain